MIALYILLGIIALIVLILCLTLGIDFSFSDAGTNLKVIVGPFKITVIPGKDKKKNYRKLAKQLKGTKISETVFEKKEKKKAKKPGKKIKFTRTGNSVDDFISSVSEMSNDPEALRLLLIGLKELALDFRNHLRINVKKLMAYVDTGDAAKTCITCGTLNALLSCFFEFADNYTRLAPIKENCAGIFPAFDGSGYNFNISFSVKTRTIHLLRALISSVTNNTKIQKQITPAKERK